MVSVCFIYYTLLGGLLLARLLGLLLLGGGRVSGALGAAARRGGLHKVEEWALFEVGQAEDVLGGGPKTLDLSGQWLVVRCLRRMFFFFSTSQEPSCSSFCGGCMQT